MLKVYAQGRDIDDNWDTIHEAVKYVKSRAEWKDLTRFHNYLQISVLLWFMALLELVNLH